MTSTQIDKLSFIPKTPAEATKAILVIAVTLFAFLRAALADGFTPVEGLQFVIQAVTLIPVFLLAGTLVKTIAAFVLAGLQALVVPFGVLVGWQDWGSVTFDDWAGAILAAFLAVGIAVVPNAPPKVITADENGVYKITVAPEVATGQKSL